LWGLLAANKDFILSLARSRLSLISSGRSIASVIGRLVIVCLSEETKTGAFPPGMEGKLGMEKEFLSLSSLSLSISSSLLILFFNCNCLNLSCCNSFSLARNGFGLLNTIGLIETAGDVVDSTSSVLNVFDPLCRTDDGLMLSEAAPNEDVEMGMLEPRS